MNLIYLLIRWWTNICIQTLEQLQFFMEYICRVFEQFQKKCCPIPITKYFNNFGGGNMHLTLCSKITTTVRSWLLCYPGKMLDNISILFKPKPNHLCSGYEWIIIWQQYAGHRNNFLIEGVKIFICSCLSINRNNRTN